MNRSAGYRLLLSIDAISSVHDQMDDFNGVGDREHKIGVML